LAAARTEWYGAFQRALLKQGVQVHPSQFEHWFISTVHTETDINQTLKAVEKAVAEIKSLVKP